MVSVKSLYKIFVLSLSYMIPAAGALAQAPFLRTGQIFMVVPGTGELMEVSVSPTYNSVQTNLIGALPPGGLDAMGFRKTDNLLYGINPANNRLYKVGLGAAAQNLGAIGLDNTLLYAAGDVSPDGNFLYSVGSKPDGYDVHLAKTALSGASFTTVFIPISANRRLADIAFDPFEGTLYGYDAVYRRFVRINPNDGSVVALAEIAAENEIFGLFFDAFGDLYAYGRSVFGIVDALFLVNKNTGIETRITTGPNAEVSDMASCPFSVEMKMSASSDILLPCSDLRYTYQWANGSGETLINACFEHPLPPGFHVTGITGAPSGATLDTISKPGSILLKDLTIPAGLANFSILMRLGDLPEGAYSSQASLRRLPALYGGVAPSDNTKTPGFEDSTRIDINRFEEDSLFNRWFLCYGETLLLDGKAYGNDVRWNTGARTPDLTVDKRGVYVLEAGNTCESVYVSHDVTTASCPYNIKILHTFEPDTIFPCGETIWRFIIANDSGEPRYGASLHDTLPEGFRFVKMLRNPFGGDLQTEPSKGIIRILNMTLKTGADTLDFLVKADERKPGAYKTRAILRDLPLVMGPTRLSDDPLTFPFDSSALYITGAVTDSTFTPKIICQGATLQLDARPFGKTWRWADGSKSPEYEVKAPGNYTLTLLDGCRPAAVVFQVREGDRIFIDPPPPYMIHLGEQLRLAPRIWNAGDTLSIRWSDPLGASLSCLDCPAPLATPSGNIAYRIEASNKVCSDSAYIEVKVDPLRRIYFPNAFSPNDDGENDYFYLQSPDFGTINSLSIYDRWGGRLFSTTGSAMNEQRSGWDGFSHGKPAPEGVYIWVADITFIDGKRAVFQGDVLVRR